MLFISATCLRLEKDRRLPTGRIITMAEKDQFLSPATTPSSVTGDDKYLLPYAHKAKKQEKLPWHEKYKPPYALLTASFLEILVHAVMKDQTPYLRFDPNKQTQIWRFVSYMLVHGSWYHLILNVTMQCLFALLLERQQDSIRVFLVYVGGGIMGALGAACTSPDLVIGASAGVYALLISQLADATLNYKVIKYKKTRFVSVGIIVLSDITYNLIHFKNQGFPSISWGAHIAGAVAGLFLGFLLYKNHGDDKRLSGILFYFGAVLTVLTVFGLILVDYQVRKCTPTNLIHSRYLYVC
ncbi:protein rhomboid-like isoform X2 [Onthophagus taurus]|uniref:protein rhomboid-like isoform X2 n=1 Tax=Onthophagus taurus TaxID=166361 RepID=UPI0039BEC030